MTPDQQTALDKIKKLLRMKRGGTQHEAETAEALAQVIAAKAGIDLGRVNIDDTGSAEQPIAHRMVGEWAIVPCEAHYAAQICQSFFNINSLEGESVWCSRLYFIGTDVDLDVAGYAFKFLIREFRWQWNHRRGRCRKRTDFIWGVYCGLGAKLKERFGKQEATGIVVHQASKRAAYIKQEWGKTESSSIAPKKVGRGASHGYEAGRDIEIRGGLKPAPAAAAPRLNGQTERKLLQPAAGQLGLL